MQCPTDGTQLVMSERSGVEIDYCPQCRGVWLDRGELDKIIDRVALDAPPQRPRAAAQPTPPAYPSAPSSGYTSQPYPSQPYYGKKKGHWLMELFD